MKKNMQDSPPTFTPKFYIIDDDPIVSKVMKKRILAKFPDSEVITTTEPVVAPDKHIYLVDNDFSGDRMAVHLLRQIRELNPNALVIAMSSSLDQKALEELMNGGCNAVYNKSNQAQADEIFAVIDNYVNIISNQHTLVNARPLAGILQSLQNLIQQWNKRLSKDLH